MTDTRLPLSVFLLIALLAVVALGYLLAESAVRDHYATENRLRNHRNIYLALLSEIEVDAVVARTLSFDDPRISSLLRQLPEPAAGLLQAAPPRSVELDPILGGSSVVLMPASAVELVSEEAPHLAHLSIPLVSEGGEVALVTALVRRSAGPLRPRAFVLRQEAGVWSVSQIYPP